MDTGSTTAIDPIVDFDNWKTSYRRKGHKPSRHVQQQMQQIMRSAKAQRKRERKPKGMGLSCENCDEDFDSYDLAALGIQLPEQDDD